MKERELEAAIDRAEVEALINRLERQQLCDGDGELIGRLLRLVLTLVRLLEQKNASLARLKWLLFGPRSERRAKTLPQGDQGSHAEEHSAPASDDGDTSRVPSTTKSVAAAGQTGSPPRPGHGRLKSAAYTGATTVRCQDPALRPGDPCPDRACRGHLYDTKAALTFIRLEGRPVINATRFEQPVLRCSACQARFAAPLPPGIPPEKYDATADAAIALLKYGAGMPLYRLSRLQELMGIPLPPATQFERCEEVANAAWPVYLELQRQAAAGEVLYSDDTGVKILTCLKETKQLPKGERTGLHTTGIGAQIGTNRVALYFSGRRYSGENLAELVKLRPAGSRPPLVMADAEAKNWTPEFERVVAKCLAHGRRQFIDIEAAFPVECRRVLDDLADVYRFDAQTRTMTPEQRLAHHQAHSGPLLAELRQWAQKQLEDRLVEPNSGLGKALRYLLRHYDGLTRFLTEGEAPLDNNYAERILKRAVLHRKNALSHPSWFVLAFDFVLVIGERWNE